MRTKLVTLAVGLLAVCPRAHAQSVTFGQFLGTVTDSSGAVVPGATVSIVQEGTGLAAGTTTSSEGTFALPQLPPGRYELTIELAGFRKFVSAASSSRPIKHGASRPGWSSGASRKL